MPIIYSLKRQHVFLALENNMIAQQPIQSWKRQPYVWMLILIPFSAVIMGIIMITLAIKSDTGLVVDDYYKKGKQINQVIARDQAAAALALNAGIRIDAESAEVHVNLKANSDLADNEIITLGFYHATKPGMDQSLILRHIGNNHYIAQIKPLDLGRWKIQLETETWRLTGSVHRPGGNNLQLTAMAVN